MLKLFQEWLTSILHPVQKETSETVLSCSASAISGGTETPHRRNPHTQPNTRTARRDVSTVSVQEVSRVCFLRSHPGYYPNKSSKYWDSFPSLCKPPFRLTAFTPTGCSRKALFEFPVGHCKDFYMKLCTGQRLLLKSLDEGEHWETLNPNSHSLNMIIF